MPEDNACYYLIIIYIYIYIFFFFFCTYGQITIISTILLDKGFPAWLFSQTETKNLKNDKAFSTRGLPKNSENKPRCLYFSKALFKGLIFGGAYVRTEICVSKLIGLASSEKEIYNFCFVLLCIRGKIPITNPPRGDLCSEGRFNRGFFTSRFCGAYIWRGLFSESYGNWFQCLQIHTTE